MAGALLIVVAGCSNAGDEAKRRYEIAEAGGAGYDELCRLAGEVAGTYKVGGDRASYQHWKERQGLVCLSATACRQIVGGCTPS